MRDGERQGVQRQWSVRGIEVRVRRRLQRQYVRDRADVSCLRPGGRNVHRDQPSTLASMQVQIGLSGHQLRHGIELPQERSRC